MACVQLYLTSVSCEEAVGWLWGLGASTCKPKNAGKHNWPWYYDLDLRNGINASRKGHFAHVLRGMRQSDQLWVLFQGFRRGVQWWWRHVVEGPPCRRQVSVRGRGHQARDACWLLQSCFPSIDRKVQRYVSLLVSVTLAEGSKTAVDLFWLHMCLFQKVSCFWFMVNISEYYLFTWVLNKCYAQNALSGFKIGY